MPKHEPEVVRAMQRAQARSLLKAIEEGDRIEREGLPFYCNRMMAHCHRAAGICPCDEYDRRNAVANRGK